MVDITKNFTKPESVSGPDLSLCKEPGCFEKWVIDRMCRNHYHIHQNRAEAELRAKRDSRGV